MGRGAALRDGQERLPWRRHPAGDAGAADPAGLALDAASQGPGIVSPAAARLVGRACRASSATHRRPLRASCASGAPRTLFDYAEASAPAPEPGVPATEPPRPTPAPTFQTLLCSEMYGAQKQLVQKHLPDDTTVLGVLEALDRHGGTLTFAALAQQAGVLPLRLDGLLAKLQRLLNVDGYEVLQVDRTQNRVSLNVPLLRRQFELE